jgi:hypothetical protein
MVDPENVQWVHNSENHYPLFPRALAESVNRTFNSKEVE